MKVIKLTIIVILFMVGCSQSHKGWDTFSFSRYNNKDILVEEREFEIKRTKVNDIDSIVIFSHNSFQDEYEQKTISTKGIFNKCRDGFIATHSFTDTVNSYSYCRKIPPFLNQNVILMGMKTFIVGSKPYKIYHFAEHNEVDTGFDYDTYYLENVGFICYYNFDRNEYLLCNSINNLNIPLEQLGKKLTSDTTFFAKYTLTKMFPDYYRERR